MTSNTTATLSAAGDDMFRAIADPSRRKILTLLAREDLPLKRIEDHFTISRPAVLKHLRVLKDCKLVRARRRGRETIHGLNTRPLKVVTDWVAQLDTLWADSLERLKRQLEGDV